MRTPSDNTPLLNTDLKWATLAKITADKWGIPLVTAISPAQPCYLTYTDAGLSLIDQTASGTKALTIDFLASKDRHQKQSGDDYLLARAMGKKNLTNVSVIDATGGLGCDAFILLTLGANLRVCERYAPIAALLDDAVERAKFDPRLRHQFEHHFQLIKSDAIEYLAQLTTKEKPDIVYLDPMYPSLEKTAASKKEMRTLRLIAGDDTDAEILFLTAIKAATQRVVVKRAKSAPSISAAIKPHHTLIGKSTRFDVYNA